MTTETRKETKYCGRCGASRFRFFAGPTGRKVRCIKCAAPEAEAVTTCKCGTPIEKLHTFGTFRDHHDADGNEVGESMHTFYGCRSCGQSFCDCGKRHEVPCRCFGTGLVWVQVAEDDAVQEPCDDCDVYEKRLRTAALGVLDEIEALP